MAMDPGPVSVLVVDDHRLMREGTAALFYADERLSARSPAWPATGARPWPWPSAAPPTSSCSTSTCPSWEASSLRRPAQAPSAGMEVLILTVSERDDDLYAALRLGAAGYLLKDMPADEGVQAVLEAGRGEPPHRPAPGAADAGRLGHEERFRSSTRWPSSAPASERSSGSWPRGCATARSPSLA